MVDFGKEEPSVEDSLIAVSQLVKVQNNEINRSDGFQFMQHTLEVNEGNQMVKLASVEKIYQHKEYL